MAETKTELVYRLDNVDADDGVNIFDIAPILMDFGNLIRAANDALGLEQKIEVKVKPFKEGSWITEFILHREIIHTMLTNPSILGIEGLLSILGFDATKGFKGVAGIVRFTKGKVNNFTKDEKSDKVTYTDENGNKLVVSATEHRLTQSPLVQINYYNGVLAPLEKFPTASSVSIGLDKQAVQKFTEEDRKYFEEYARTELLEDVDQNTVTMNGVYIKPRRGSYSGEEKAYSFIMGESVLWPTTIEDEKFLDSIKTGDLRLHSEDVLKVNLEVSQKKDVSNKLLTQYSIKEVIEYIKYEKPHQLRFDNTS